MTLQILRQRYLRIAKDSLKFLMEKGFEKKGMKYSKQKKNFILKIYPLIEHAYLNTDKHYNFVIIWEINSRDPAIVQAYISIGGNTKLVDAPLLYCGISFTENDWVLTPEDPTDYDEECISRIQQEIKEVILPLFDRIHSIDDVIHLAEEEAKIERKDRKFFPYAIYANLAMFYAAKGWKDKALEMCDKHIEATPSTAQDLAEEKKKKYIKYFEKYPEFIRDAGSS
ncbi:MAG: hypothetical protein K2X02_08325 [Alphaproteobacteria bacterium]|nr:hypothetical protein [Alphaproteobacteria bacterium]